MTSIARIQPSEIKSAPLVTGLNYWISLYNEKRSLPARRDLDPTDIPSVLPYIELTDVINGGEDFRFRLIGTHLVDVDGVNPTGDLLSTFFQMPSYRDYQLSLYRHVVQRCVPLYSRSVMPLIESNSIFQTERLYCPLASDGRTVDHIINFQICKGLVPGTVTIEMAYDPTKGNGLVAEIDIGPLPCPNTP